MRLHDIALTTSVALVTLLVAIAFEHSESKPARPDGSITLSSLEPCCGSGTPRPTKALRLALAPLSCAGNRHAGMPALGAYLERRLGMPFRTTVHRTFADVAYQLRIGDADIGLVGSVPYVLGHRDFGLDPLAVPIVGGSTTTRSCLIVAAAGPVRSWPDLRGRTFAFTDPLAFAGRFAAVHALAGLGETPERFFGKIVYSHGQERSIEAVAQGQVDGACVDALALGERLERDPQLRKKVRVAWRSTPIENGPIAALPGLLPDLRARLVAALLGMDGDPDGSATLLDLGLDGFAPVAPGRYASLAAMLRATGVRL